MTSSKFNDHFLAAEFSEEKPVNVTPTSIEEIRARKGRIKSEPDQEASSPKGLVDQLVDRVSHLEEEVRRGQVTQQQLDELMGQVKDLNARVNSLLHSLQGTVGVGARHSFVCRNCRSKGQVAARLHCTSCGEENWWGWWPPQR
ncbi:MAG TPA: hypothetical protein VFA32_01535 [Dehalococcoidia bacterium]|nr:hypothetical protein [Dehalococcoidia bacterium]